MGNPIKAITNQNRTKQNKTNTSNQTKNQPKKTEEGLQPAMGITCKMTSYVSSLEWPKNQNTKQKRTKTHQWATSGDRSNKSSMRKPGIPPARIPEITKSSRTGMIFTQALRSKHRRRRVATRVVRNERTVKQEGETWSKVKMTARLRHSGCTQSPLSSPFSIIIIMAYENTAC